VLSLTHRITTEYAFQHPSVLENGMKRYEKVLTINCPLSILNFVELSLIFFNCSSYILEFPQALSNVLKLSPTYLHSEEHSEYSE
jgi:hypothetical protein